MRTIGKAAATIEFEDHPFFLLKAIAEREKSSLGRIVRLACDAFAIEYLAQHGKLTGIRRDENDEPIVINIFELSNERELLVTTEFLKPALLPPGSGVKSS